MRFHANAAQTPGGERNESVCTTAFRVLRVLRGCVSVVLWGVLYGSHGRGEILSRTEKSERLGQA